MSLFSRLFGGGGSQKNEPDYVEYEGFRITPAPIKEQQGFRLSAVIEKDFDGETKTHKLVRADVISDFQTCAEAAIAKAKQMIDQMGDQIF